jgi:hypothetical protein
MPSVETTRVLVDSSASEFAFRAGQSLERLLMEGAVNVARRSADAIVTKDHIQSCLDECLLEQLREQVRATTHEDLGREQRKTA